MVELDVKITAGDLYDFMLMHNYSKASGVMGSGLGALMILWGSYTKYWILVIGGVVLLLYLPWVLFIKSRQQAVSPMFKQPLHYVMDENGVTISQGEESTTQSWDEMWKAVSTGKSIILYTSPVNATIFPKARIGDKKTAVIQMISTHMPPKKVKIRL